MKKQYVKMSPVTITVPILPFFSIVIGLSLLIWVGAPILSFALFYTSKGFFVSPLADTAQAAQTEPANTNGVDYSKASSWFPKSTKKNSDTKINEYQLSIPKLGIEKSMVRIGSDDLSKNLIHYGGTALPGAEGNSVIFGHSVLPAFYNPKNYLTIFSLLPTLKQNDDLFLHFDGIDYRYEVVSMRVTTPDDVSGLEQTFDNSYVTLVTCVPPGTYAQRLWVKFKQKPYGSAKETIKSSKSTRN